VTEKKAEDPTDSGGGDHYVDDTYTGQASGPPTRVFKQKPIEALRLRARRKMAGNYQPESPEEGRLGPDRQLTAPPDLATTATIVNPGMPTYDVVRTMTRMDMGRDDKAVYLSKAGFLPQAISAILAQVDGYTETSEV
jgi:hypothetical protein